MVYFSASTQLRGLAADPRGHLLNRDGHRERGGSAPEHPDGAEDFADLVI